MIGFTFPYKGNDVFVATYKKYKTKKLAGEILRKMLLPDAPARRDELLYWLQNATLETKKYGIVIRTQNSTIIDPEKKTIIIKL